MPRRGLSGLSNSRQDQYPGANFNLLPGGRIQASPSNTGQARSIYGVDFPVVGYPDTGWDPNQRLDQYQGSIPGVGMPLRGEIGGGPSSGQQTYSSGITPFDPLDYGVNPPPSEDVSPDLINTFYGSNVTNSTVGSSRSRYPNLSNAPPVIPQDYSDPQTMMSWPGASSVPGGYIGARVPASQTPIARASAVEPSGFLGSIWRKLNGQATGNYSYPVPGAGGFPSTFGGGQSWQSNAVRSPGGFAAAAPSIGGGTGGGGIAGGSGYGSGRFAGPSVSFGYGGTQIGPTSGSLFYGQAVQHF